MTAIRTLLRQYRTAFRDEPKLRSYAIASFVDDIGLAVSAWAAMLLMTNLFTTQRARASVMLPSLLCFLIGTIVSGPLADGAGRLALRRLARWRWRLVVWARLVEALFLVILLVQLASGPPTIPRVLPFVLVAAFTKTAFRPTRIAFAVDLLTKETAQVDDAGRPLLDERGNPLRYKTHLLALTSIIGTLSAAATLVGLLLGGRVFTLVAGRYWQLFLVDAIMHVAFVAIVALFCHPTRSWRSVRLIELVRDVVDGPEPEQAPRRGPRSVPDAVARASVLSAFSSFGRSLGEGLRFLFQKKQRTLLLLVLGAMLVELVTESYDGKMIIKHVMHGTDDAVRHAELAWSLVGLVGVALVPALARAVRSIGRLFLVTMLLDAFAIMIAGHVSGSGHPNAIVRFTLAIAVDHALTLTSSTLIELAQNSASSAVMRGRILGTFAFLVIIGDMLVEGIATSVSEAIGIPAMLVRVGIVQLAVVVVLAWIGGAELRRFGLHQLPDQESRP